MNRILNGVVGRSLKLKPRPMIAEAMEPRRLFTIMHGDYSVYSTIAIGSPNQSGGEYTNGELFAAAGSSITVDISVGSSFSTEFVNNSDPDPSGTVTIFNVDTQQVVATLTLVGKGYSDTGPANDTLNQGYAYSVATGQITMPSTRTTFFSYYSGDGNYPSVNSFDTSDTGRPGGQLTVDPLTQSQLQFIQGPLDVAVGDKIAPPITVQVQDLTGAVKTSSTDRVMLTLGSATTGAGTLGGTLTESAVNGVATFSDITVSAGGSYVLHAADSTDSTVSGINSAMFDVTPGKLVFINKPHDGSAGEALNPGVTVELQDANNKAITDDDGMTVSLATIGNTGGAPLTGNTATLSGGLATFNNLVFKNAGFYTLQASDAAGDAQAVASQIKIAGDKLVFSRQPVNGDPDAPLALALKLVDSKGKLVTDATGPVELSLNTVSGGVDAVLSGTVTANFVGGVASFSATTGPSINAAGVYTFTAADDADAATAVTSKQFTIGTLQLVFLKPPKQSNVGDQLLMSVAVENKKHKVDTNVNGGGTTLSLTALTGGNGATLSSYSNDGFVNGVETFTATSSPFIDTPGTYQLTATGGDGDLASSTRPGTFKPLKVAGNHLIFAVSPTTTNEFDGLTFTVDEVDSKNKVVTSDNVSTVKLSLSGSPTTGGDTEAALVNGVATWSPTGGGALSVLPDRRQVSVHGHVEQTSDRTRKIQIVQNRAVQIRIHRQAERQRLRPEIRVHRRRRRLQGRHSHRQLGPAQRQRGPGSAVD